MSSDIEQLSELGIGKIVTMFRAITMQDAQSGTVKNVKCPIPVSKSANPAKKIPQHQDCLTPKP